MLKSFLLFFLSIIIVALFAFGMIAYKVYKMIDKFKKGKPFFDANSSSERSSDFSSGRSSAQDSSRYTNMNETIIDTRRPDVANRKIISSDEGEYVDFKES